MSRVLWKVLYSKTTVANHRRRKIPSSSVHPRSTVISEISAPISAAELKRAVDAMQVGKLPGPDGLMLEFYKLYWELIGAEYHSMVMDSVRTGCFPSGVTSGMLALLHKGGERKLLLTNWKPITLLNLSYKIYAKALQLRLQPVLMEIISSDQSAFLVYP
jgi:hypothetical protein